MNVTAQITARPRILFELRYKSNTVTFHVNHVKNILVVECMLVSSDERTVVCAPGQRE